MSNGGVGFRLSNQDYETIDSGDCLTSGPFKGCIKVGLTHYWIEADSPDWILHSGTVDDNRITYMIQSVWDKIKENGTWTWISRSEWWDSGRDTFRLTGIATGDVSLVTYP